MTRPAGLALPLRGIRSAADKAGVNPKGLAPSAARGLTPAGRRTTRHPAEGGPRHPARRGGNGIRVTDPVVVSGACSVNLDRQTAPSPGSTPSSTPDDGAIALLRELVPRYVRRVSPSTSRSDDLGGPAPRAVIEPPAAAGDSRLCVEIEGVVTIDNERRIAWPAGSDRPVAAALRPVGDVIEVSDTAVAVGPRRPLDRRGRLRIPSAILRATNLEPGHRVLVARQPGGWILAPARQVVIRTVP